MMGESYTDSSFLRCINISFNERTLRRILLCIRETKKTFGDQNTDIRGYDASDEKCI